MKLVLDRVEDPVTILSYVSGMYGWIVDGISSLFEPVTGQNHNEWPGKGNVSQDIPTRPGVDEQRHESLIRPAKRNYQRSVDHPKAVIVVLCRCSLSIVELMVRHYILFVI